MTTERDNSLELRYGNQINRISRTLSYEEAQVVAREMFGIREDVIISFHRPWSNWAGLYDRIASDSWDGVARVSSALDYALGYIFPDAPSTWNTPAVQDGVPALRTSDSRWDGDEEHAARPFGASERRRAPLVRASSPDQHGANSAAPSQASSSRPEPGSSRSARGGDIFQIAPQVQQQPLVPPPPPYSRLPTEENARKVTFLVSTPMGDMVTLSAKRSVRVSKALEAACNTFKLRPAKCRLHHAGWVYGSSEMERLTLQSLDIEDGDQLGISWDDVIVRSELYLYHGPRSLEPEDASLSSVKKTTQPVRVVVKLAPQWSFDAVLPPAPIDARAGSSSVAWQTRIQPDGQLMITNTSRPVHCLAWESQAKPLVQSTSNGHSNSSSIASVTSAAPINVEPSSPQRQGVDHSEAVLSSVSVSASRSATSSVPVAGLSSPGGLQDFGQALLHFLWATSYLGLINLLGFLLGAVLFRPSSSSSSRRDGRPWKRNVDSSLLEDQGPFEPMESAAFLDDGNSVLLQAGDVEPYLLDAYRDMGIPDEIVHNWLRFIAVRFLSKAGYAKASGVRITPEPEHVVRALLVFCGVQSDEVDTLWPKAKRRGGKPYDGSWAAAVLGSGAIDSKGKQRQKQMGMNAAELSWVEVFQDDVL
ncbi:hypothetical protein FRB98_004531 [Tulasnella sp. 332]|nr:hypothetical protein FRB98_004531 [Tulasnella sp. 332]